MPLSGQPDDSARERRQAVAPPAIQTGQGWTSSRPVVDVVESPTSPAGASIASTTGVDLGVASVGSRSPDRLPRPLSDPDESVTTPRWHLTDEASLLELSVHMRTDAASPAAPRSPSALTSSHNFSHRHRLLAFWTRVALVLILAASVMGTALFVLSLYTAPMYQEADRLGLRLLLRCSVVADLQISKFIMEMVLGARVLSGNLHGQGIVPLIRENVYHPLARKLLWETFQSIPYLDSTLYLTERGSLAYVRMEGDPVPRMLYGRPANFSQPSGTWVAAIAPVDPKLGTWTIPEDSTSLTPLAPVTQMPFYSVGLTQPENVVGLWAGLAPTQNATKNMSYIAMTPLLITDGNSSNSDSGAALGNLTTQGNATDGGDAPGSVLAEEGAASPGAGDAVNLPAIGVVAVVKSTRSLRALAADVDTSLQGGRLFLSRARDGMLIMASKGRMASGAMGDAAITAEASDDPVIAAAGRHLRAAFPIVSSSAGRKSLATPLSEISHLSDRETHRVTSRESSASGEDEDDLTAAAARSGLCWAEYNALITVDGQRWYLHCAGKVYGGPSEPLDVVAVTLIPRDSIMGELDATRRSTLATVLGVALAIAVLGVAAIYASTTYIKRVASRTIVALESVVEEKEGEMERMATEMDNLRTKLPWGSSGRNSLDMRTPMETVQDMLADLAHQNKRPTAKTLSIIQELLKMPELHMPVVLQETLGIRDGGPSAGPGLLVQALGGVPPKMLDEEMSAWLRSSIMLLPPPPPPPPPPLSSHALPRAGSLAFYRRSENDEMSVHGYGGNPLARVSSGGAGDVTRDAIIDIVRQVVSQGCPEEEMSLVDYGNYIKRRASLTVHVPTPATSSNGGAPPGIPQAPLPLPESVHAQRTAWLAAGKEGSVATAESGQGGLQPVTMRASLEGIGEWNFDTMGLAVASSGQPILWMGLELYRRAGLLKVFRLPLDKLTRFLVLLDDGMLPNPYHNATHVADVANSLYHIIRHSGVGSYLLRLDVLAAITAALVHDFRHPGLNNDYVVRSHDELALRYNDRNVLENYHVAEAFFLLAVPELNFFDVLDAEDFRYVRNVVIELVLGSDLKRHFELVDLFRKRVKDKESPLSREKEADRLLLMQVALKIADLGHAAKKLSVHRRWADAITEEFYLQGDKEKARGLKVSPFMDREVNDLPKSQLGFFSFIAFPLYEAWVAAFPDSAHLLEEMQSNIKYWEGLRDNHKKP